MVRSTLRDDQDRTPGGEPSYSICCAPGFSRCCCQSQFHFQSGKLLYIKLFLFGFVGLREDFSYRCSSDNKKRKKKKKEKRRYDLSHNYRRCQCETPKHVSILLFSGSRIIGRAPVFGLNVLLVSTQDAAFSDDTCSVQRQAALA